MNEGAFATDGRGDVGWLGAAEACLGGGVCIVSMVALAMGSTNDSTEAGFFFFLGFFFFFFLEGELYSSSSLASSTVALRPFMDVSVHSINAIAFTEDQSLPTLTSRLCHCLVR